MPHTVVMEQQELILQLKDFLQNNSACTQTLSCLKPDAEIQITVADTLHFSVSYDDHAVVIKDQKSSKADFIFSSTPQAIETLINEDDLTPAQLGIKFLKQVVTQEVSVSMPGNIFHVSRKGYLDILKVGGVEFLNELKKIGLTNIPKILSKLRNLKN